MEPDNGKRKADGHGNGGGERQNAAEEDNGVNNTSSIPGDEEVNEFFAILKRVKVAIKYFQERRGSADQCSGAPLPPPAPPPPNLEFEQEDFRGVVKDGNRLAEKPNKGLDLNCPPDPDDDSRST